MGLGTLDPSFPITEWDRLLHKAVITLNLLRNAQVAPKILAYAYVFGQYDINSNPMAPPGTKVVIYDKHAKQGSWQYHGSEGHYVSPALEHYQ